jgi:hypothetical protein
MAKVSSGGAGFTRASQNAAFFLFISAGVMRFGRVFGPLILAAHSPENV